MASIAGGEAIIHNITELKTELKDAGLHHAVMPNQRV